MAFTWSRSMKVVTSGGKKNAAVGLRRQSFDRAFNVGDAVNWRNDRLDRQRQGRRFKRTPIVYCSKIVGIVDHRNARRSRRNLLQRLQNPTDDRQLQRRKSRHVATGPREACDKSCFDGSGGARDDDRNCASQLHQDRNHPTANGDDHVRLQLHEIGGIGPHQVHIVRGPTLVELDINTRRPTPILKLLFKCLHTILHFLIARRKRH